ncbi:MAG: MFS transporter [Acidimicrobiia bacterium]|nr:MFS transporter [Acidimicrobiia bacterium]
MLLAMTTWFSASAVVPQLRADWSLSASESAMLTIAVQLGFVAGALLSSLLTLADVLPPRRMMLVGAIGAALANLLLLGVDSAALATPLRFLTGFFLAAVYPSGMKSMATWFRRGRGMALGVMVGALTLGSAAPHLVNGLGGLNWCTVVWTTSLLTVLGGVVAETMVSDGPFAFPRARFRPGQAVAVFRDRKVRLACYGYFGHMWELYAMWAWIVVFFSDLLDERGLGGEAVAPFIAFATIGIGAAGCVVGGVLADRRGRPWLTSVAMVASGSASVLIGLIRNSPLGVVITVALFWGFWVVADSAQFSAMITEVADQTYVGTALTLQLAIGFSLTVVTIWLVPLLQDELTWRWAFAVLVPGPALGTAAMRRLSSLMR